VGHRRRDRRAHLGARARPPGRELPRGERPGGEHEVALERQVLLPGPRVGAVLGRVRRPRHDPRDARRRGHADGPSRRPLHLALRSAGRQPQAHPPVDLLGRLRPAPRRRETGGTRRCSTSTPPPGTARGWR
jgi:hypothetical protein